MESRGIMGGGSIRRSPPESRSHGGQRSMMLTSLTSAPAFTASNDRINILLMEANEISQYLKKDYV